MSIGFLSLAHLVSLPVLIPEYSDRQWLYVLLLVISALLVTVLGARHSYKQSQSNLRKEFLIVFTGLFLVIEVFFGILFIFSSEKDSSIIKGRKLKYTIKTESEYPTYYIYEWESLSDGMEESEIMEKDFIYRKSVWRSDKKGPAEELFNGKEIPLLNNKKLKLETIEGRKYAFINDAPAKIEILH